MTDLSPMVVQYREIKKHYQDAILFFRLGDFYEMFNEDAELASLELQLTLTGRGEGDNHMPMCGIPYHAAENYIAKLLEKGHKVAICEQVEDPKLAKGVVRREVIRVLTPGTILESSMLSDRSSNYLAAVAYDKGKYGLAYIEASTGEFKVAEIDDPLKLKEELERLAPAEILLSDMITDRPQFAAAVITGFKDMHEKPAAEEKLKEFFRLASLAAFGLEDFSAGLAAALAILEYLKDTQKTTLGHVNKIQPYRIEGFMFIDSQTRRNLELTQIIRDQSFKGSLLWVLDQCQTNMGSRLLRNWMLAPLLNVGEIDRRLDAIEELKANAVFRAEVSQELKKVYDVERLTGRVATQNANARDLVSLAGSLRRLPRLKELLKDKRSEALNNIKVDLKEGGLLTLVELILNSIVDQPPHQLTEGGLIKEGYHEELDELKGAARGGKEWIAALENQERARTGIKSLKMGFTRVFGYYIEVSNSNLAAVPPDYIRKQTLVNCERFITPELKEKESLILNADKRSQELEYQLFCEIRKQAAEHTLKLQAAAQALSQLDALLSLAEVAAANGYCRPKISGEGRIEVSSSRHPVVEKTLGSQNFTPNDIELDNEERFLMITGPNMAGKSTYMRQVALICLMAQMGSYVPAKSAEVGITDRIFTRIGAMDNIFSGQSTFMVEMTETANILNNATKNSLIILDEIGRGTATFDGMSIAAAVAEYIYNKIKAKTLFATHYHEITQLAEKHSGMKNLNVAVREEADRIIFLHKIVEGPADKSYGIAVAKLAGLPPEVIKRARQVYVTLDMIEKKTLLS